VAGLLTRRCYRFF